MSQRTVAIIQARTGSSRFPGKVLELLGDRPVLSHVIHRVVRAGLVDDVVVATTDLQADESIQHLCHSEGVECFLGPAEDVLTRYCQVATATKADVVIRITADCPLVSPTVIDDVICARVKERADYASNTLRRTYPHGLDVECFTYETLTLAGERACIPYEREHVTPFIYNHSAIFSLYSVESPSDWSSLRWTIDYPEDLTFLRLCSHEIPACLDTTADWLDFARKLSMSKKLSEAQESLKSAIHKDHC